MLHCWFFMIIAPAIFVFLVIAIMVVAVGLVICVYEYTRTISKNTEIEQELLTIKRSQHEDVIKALEKAQKETEEIIANANKKATEILGEAKVFSSDEREHLQEKLRTIIDNQTIAFNDINKALSKEYQKSFISAEQEAIKLFTKTTKSITDTAVSEIQDFKSVLENETVNSQKIVNTKIEQAYQQVEQELSQYKKQQLEEIDKHASERMRQIARYVFSNGLTIDQQELLIQKAIDALKEKID